MKVKCPKCKKIDYEVINFSSTRDGKIELRECNNCNRRYRVKVLVGGMEIFIA